MILITKEIPTGTIDGSNTTFTTLHDISIVDDIFIDGEYYEGSFVIQGKTIELDDAPNTSLYIDYYVNN